MLTLDLNSMTTSEGFRIEGDAVYDFAGNRASVAGDVNGDGFDDFLIGAPGNDAGGSNAGAVYVIFGNAGGLSDFDLTDLTSSQGFKIVGEAADDQVGNSAASAGDINGDGFGDLVIGAYRDDADGSYSGSAYVIFGKSGGFGTIDLGSLAPADGFTITGDGTLDRAGASVACAGDVNGDGLDDIVIGAPTSNGSTSGTGGAYVIFGAESGLSDIDLSSLDPSQGFTIFDTDGIAAGESVSSAGDVNGDGFDDFTIGAPQYGDAYYDYYGTYLYGPPGATFTIYGKAGGPGDIDLGALTADQGFLVGPIDVSVPIGDFDGDGLDDRALMRSSSAIIDFGSGGSSSIAHAVSVAGVGDFNGDGFADVIVGSGNADYAFVIYGRPDHFQQIDLGGVVDDRDGIKIVGHRYEAFNRLGAGAGDVNGDGFADIVFGAPRLGAFLDVDHYSYSAETGGAYVVYGQAPTGPVGRIGGAAGQAIHGGAYDDTLDGQGGNDSLYGAGGSDILIGGTGNDWLDGGTGADTLIGGIGADTYVIGSAGDIIVERAGEGADTARSGVTYTLGDNVENLILTGAAAIDGTGNALANSITGNAAANTLDGGAGNDVLNGKAGADTMIGGTGNDLYYVDNLADTVTESSAAGGHDKVSSTVTLTLGANVEDLTLTGTAAINGTGNSLANIMTGNAAANTLNGKAGADTMIGGLGNDLYYVDNAGDIARERSASGGTDTVSSTVGFTLGANFENLALTGAGATNGTGNALANVLVGNGAANVLKGLGGADTLKGGVGDDTLVGGTGQDMLTGGTGNDKFAFNAGDTSADHAAADHVLDFATGDKIDLHSIDADTTLTGNQAFHFIGSGGFTVGDAGALHYGTSGGVTWIEGDTNGDGAADFAIYLAGAHTMAGTDFVL